MRVGVDVNDSLLCISSIDQQDGVDSAEAPQVWPGSAIEE